MIQNKLINKFGGHINHMSCIYINEGEKHLRGFLESFKSLNTVIEVGTYQGVSACIIAEYAKSTHTIDIEKQDLTDEIIFFSGKNIDTHIIKNRKQEVELVESLFLNYKIDLVFLDGEHYNGELKRDFEMCKECSNIIVHDYDKDFPEVYDFCNNLKGYKKEVRGSFVLLTKEKVTRGRKKKQ